MFCYDNYFYSVIIMFYFHIGQLSTPKSRKSNQKQSLLKDLVCFDISPNHQPILIYYVILKIYRYFTFMWYNNETFKFFYSTIQYL